MKAVTQIKGKLEVDREPHEPSSIKVGKVDIITLLEAYNGLNVEIEIRLELE